MCLSSSDCRPVSRPESELEGASYAGSFNDTNDFPMVVTDPSSWVFAGTGLRADSQIQGIVGYEFDAVLPGLPIPSHVITLSTSPVYNVYGQTETANSTIYQATSRAWVFNAGTIDWSFGLDNFAPQFSESVYRQRPAEANSVVEKITSNVLNRFLGGSGPESGPDGRRLHVRTAAHTRSGTTSLRWRRSRSRLGRERGPRWRMGTAGIRCRLVPLSANSRQPVLPQPGRGRFRRRSVGGRHRRQPGAHVSVRQVHGTAWNRGHTCAGTELVLWRRLQCGHGIHQHSQSYVTMSPVGRGR